VFRIFHEIAFYEWDTGARADIAYVVDQGHNLKGTIEAMIQTVTMAQSLFAKAALVDYERPPGPRRLATRSPSSGRPHRGVSCQRLPGRRGA
jgi:L-rhamnose isomerase